MKPFNIIWLCLFCFQKYEKLAKAQLKKVTKIYAQEKKKSEDREKKEVIDEVMKFINKMYLGHLYEDAKCFLFSLALYIACKQALLVLGEGDSSLSLPLPLPHPHQKKKQILLACYFIYLQHQYWSICVQSSILLVLFFSIRINILLYFLWFFVESLVLWSQIFPELIKF